MNDNQLKTWANIQLLVMRQGDTFNPFDMHPLPKGNLEEALKRLVSFIDMPCEQEVARGTIDMSPVPPPPVKRRRRRAKTIEVSQ